jgi:hypothetical protein
MPTASDSFTAHEHRISLDDVPNGLKVSPAKAPEEIAAINGFQSVEQLRAESKPLMKHADGEKHQSYIAHSPLGYCFAWDDE